MWFIFYHLHDAGHQNAYRPTLPTHRSGRIALRGGIFSLASRRNVYMWNARELMPLRWSENLPSSRHRLLQEREAACYKLCIASTLPAPCMRWDTERRTENGTEKRFFLYQCEKTGIRPKFKVSLGIIGHLSSGFTWSAQIPCQMLYSVDFVGTLTVPWVPGFVLVCFSMPCESD